MKMKWAVTRTEGPYRYPVCFAGDGARISRYTTRGHFPMVCWRIIFDGGKVSYGHKSSEDAMKYAEDYLTGVIQHGTDDYQ